MRRRLRIEGMMPERALLKLRRADIPLYDIQKISKTQLTCSIQTKDIGKVLAVYPAEQHARSPFVVTDLGAEGLAKYWQWLRRRVGVALGVLLFCIGNLQAERFVFSVDIVGSSAYTREVYEALDEHGIKPFRLYPEGREQNVCAKLLTLPGVEFCTVRKSGLRVLVELHTYTLPPQGLTKGDMRANRKGRVLSITALRGTPAKKIGEEVELGETLVYGWFLVEGGQQVCVEPIARASIACVYEKEITANTREEAFATAYLELWLQPNDSITKTQITDTDEGYFVHIEYTAIQSINL